MFKLFVWSNVVDVEVAQTLLSQNTDLPGSQSAPARLAETWSEQGRQGIRRG
jgi:hypothetical protein